MRTPSAESAHRLGELALLTTAFVLPLAFAVHSYDPASLKSAVLQWSSLAMLFGWLWQGVSRGRFQAPAAAWTSLLPALAYGAWLALRFALEPHKLAELPEFLSRLTMLVGFLAAFLGFAGARHASRFALLTAAAAWLALLGAAGSRAFASMAAPSLASLLAVAVPLALTLDLDPETPGPVRAAALLLLPAASLWVGLASSRADAAGFCGACVLFAVVAASALRTRRALLAAGLAALAAAVAAVASLAAAPAGAAAAPSAAGLGTVGAALCAWLFGAALWTGARGAGELRRAGALAESTYAAGFAAAAAGALAAAWLSGRSAAWYAWPLAGLAAGLAPLAARRAAVSVYPLPVSEDVRRALYAPALLGFAALAAMPGLWLRSDVELNSAIFAERSGDPRRAAELYAKVAPGAPGYLMSLRGRGDALAAQGLHGDALAAYDRLQLQAPDYPLVHARRGAAYAELGDWKAAASERARQAELDPLDLENLVSWTEAARASGDLEQARLAVGKAAALAPDDASVKLQLAANDLMQRRLLAKAGAGKTNGKGVARKPR